MKRLLSITGVLRTLTALMAAGLVITFAFEAWRAWNQQATAQQVVTVVTMSRDLFDGLQSLRIERGTVNTALDTADVPSAQTLQEITRLRQLSDQSLDAAEAELTAAALPDEAEAGGNLRRSREGVTKLRRDADAMLQKPKSARAAEISRAWVTAVDNVVNSVDAVLEGLAGQINRSDPFIVGLMDIKRLAWEVRAAAGTDRLMIGAAIADGSGLPDDQQRQLAVLQGRVESAWRLVGVKIEEPGMPVELKDAFARAKKSYFTDLAEKRKAIVADLVAGQAPSLSGTDWVRTSNPGLESLFTVAKTALEVADRYAADEASSARLDLMLKLSLTLVFFGIGVYALSFVVARLTGPIAAIAETTRAVAGGDLRRVILYQDRADEIGELARALAVFRDNAQAKLRIEAAQRQEQERKEQRQRVVDQHVVTFDSSIRGLLDALSKAAAEMRSTSESMSATAEQTGRQAMAVSDAATHASSNVETVATATEELAASVSEIGRQVNHAAQIANQAVSETRNTDGTVQGLSEAAQRIGEVVQLINDIASQTNLLALNATIEAARAGDAGKGFAVVASEVKSLATQTGKATEDIAAQVAAIQTATEGAVGAIKSVGHIIQQVSEISATIASAVEEQGATTKEITRNTQEAARGTQAVSVNIAGVSQGAGMTGKAADHVLTAAGELGRTADKLRTEVDAFLTRIRAA
jgi:methyl-accepting chemotaxis protein